MRSKLNGGSGPFWIDIMRCSLESLAFSNPRGFIVIDGVNGAGKSTLQNRLAARIEQTGRAAVSTREPGGTELGCELRAILQEGRVGKLAETAELFLFAADRAQHIREVIEPALSRNAVVISDRYFYSTTAFQGYGRGMNIDLVEQINRCAIGSLLPDMTILLDLDPSEGLTRNRNAGMASLQRDTFEGESLEFHTRIRDGFLALADESPTPFLVIDASGTPDEVFDAAWPGVLKLLDCLPK